MNYNTNFAAWRFHGDQVCGDLDMRLDEIGFCVGIQHYAQAIVQTLLNPK